MIPARVVIAYFSPTGGTKKVALALKEGFSAALKDKEATPQVIKARPGFTLKLTAPQQSALRSVNNITLEVPHQESAAPEVKTVNCLSVKSRAKDLQLGPNDLFILAYPVYFGRMPWAMSDWPALKGNGASAIVVSVYGNRAIEDGERETMALLQEHGFKVVGAIEAIAEHSQERTLAQGRPDTEDAADLAKMAQQIVSALEQGPLPEYRFDSTTALKAPGKAPFVPCILERTKCDDCGRCALMCPMNIIDPKTLEVPAEKADLCMGCRACIAVCKMKCRGLPPQVLSAIAARMAQIKAANPERKPNVLKLEKPAQ